MLYFVTPCSRPENLQAIRKSIFESIPKSEHPRIVWYIIVDAGLGKPVYDQIVNQFKDEFQIAIRQSPHDKPCAGHLHRNHFLDIFKNNISETQSRKNWAYFIDDDTLLHPEFYDSLVFEMTKDRAAIIFNQDWPNGSRRLDANLNNVTVCNIDMGQYAINLSMLPYDMQFLDNYCADGHFIEELYKRMPDKFVKIDKVLSVYNQLR